MRSFFALLALAVPVATASAAIPTPALKTSMPSHAARVQVTFFNARLGSCELVVGKDHFTLPGRAKLRLSVTDGSPVQLYSDMDSKLNGQTLLTVTPADALRTVMVE